ncbi:MAG: nucleoside-diphosphate sugar epimerase/dehydratase [Gemmataceae bacterium]
MPGEAMSRWRRYRLETLRFLILCVAFTAAYLLAFTLRFDFHFNAETWDLLRATLPLAVVIKLVVAYSLRGFHGWMRYVSFFDLVELVRAALIATVLLGVADLLLVDDDLRPSLLALDFMCTIMVVGGLRSAGRFLRELFWPLVDTHLLHRKRYRKALLVGANRTGVILANQINFNVAIASRVVGFLDDDQSAHGTHLGGLPILAGLDHAGEVARQRGVKDVLVLAGSLTGKQLRGMMESCERAGISLKIISNVYDLLGEASEGEVGRPRAGRRAKQGLRLQLRDVDIDDLLRREPVALDCPTIGGLLAGRVVMVTGAGGSIGAEVCRQVLSFKPRTLVLYERAENSLFFIERELRPMATAAGVELVAALGDVTDGRRLRQVFERHRPEVLFHAAAHKHVPIVELNPGEAIKNNLFGTRLVADMADEFGLQAFVMISTDKAVHPANVMGMTKQLCERYVQALAGKSKTRFVVVRFGNVLGSAGSVVPIFQEQIRRGGPVTVTHPEMRRYFMTIPEASQLVLQAGAMGQGGEIFVLDMGEPVRIVDLATDLIRLSGLRPDDIEIVFTGVRQGEKLSENLYLEAERTLPTPHPKLRAAQASRWTVEQLEPLFADLRQLTQEDDPAAVRAGLRQRFPDFDEQVRLSDQLVQSGSTAEPGSPAPDLTAEVAGS